MGYCVGYGTQTSRCLSSVTMLKTAFLGGRGGGGGALSYCKEWRYNAMDLPTSVLKGTQHASFQVGEPIRDY